MPVAFALQLYNVAPGISIPLALPYTAGSGQLTLQSVAGLPGPPFRLYVITAASRGLGLNEVLTCFKITGVSGNVLAIAYPVIENTTDQDFNIGDLAEIRDASGAITDLNNAVSSVVRTFYEGLTAAGTNQGTALPLLGSCSFQEITTTPSGTGVSLPAAAINGNVVVFNAGANPLLVYPGSGNTINNGSSPVTINAATGLTFIGSSPSNWYGVP